MRPRSANASITLRLVLVPCPNATGKEQEAAKQWEQFEQINPPHQFWDLLIRPNRYGPWPKEGLVVFLGGDQLWSVLLSARLGYRHLTYAEWVARWPFWNDRIAAMTPKVRNQLPRRFRNRCTVVGDLMADLSYMVKAKDHLPPGEWVALLPGSKKAKLCVGVPFLLEVADVLNEIRPGCQFFLPLAPTTNVLELKHFSSSNNPIALKYQSSISTITPPEGEHSWRRLITQAGTEIHLQESHPAHAPLSQCALAITTIGANTAELGALGVPMIVFLPTQHYLTFIQAWDGVLGLLARIPVMRWGIGLLLRYWGLRNHGYLSWPNITAKRLIVPEKIGRIVPKEIALEAASWLVSPKRLKGQQNDLKSLRGRPGAVAALGKEIVDLLPKI